MMRHHHERHRAGRNGWLRAAVLGANDGILSTASLLVGVAAAEASRSQLWIAGLAGLVAGAMSMGAGEYVSVSSQADSENADLERERRELAADVEGEHRELAAIYVSRGVEPALARQVAGQLMEHDALEAHARDELGLMPALRARPIQAALASASSFATGALLPLITVLLAPLESAPVIVSVTALVFLAALGAVAARAGGASSLKGALRVTLWGAAAMIATAALGTAFGVAT